MRINLLKHCATAMAIAMLGVTAMSCNDGKSYACHIEEYFMYFLVTGAALALLGLSLQVLKPAPAP